ncbi:MAG: MarR family transcriptional regulator [Clostridia bacterium]|nr:MarR family transcriptional regulator [Clostridia bacterium]
MTEKAAFQQQADLFIGTMAQLMGGEFERMLLTLSRGEFGVLMYLARHTEGVTSSMISDALRIGPGGVANVLKTMEKKGYVLKGEDKRDRRANSVTITPAGRALLDERYRQIKEQVVAHMRALGLEDSVALNGLIGRILQVTIDLENEEKENRDNTKK